MFALSPVPALVWATVINVTVALRRAVICAVSSNASFPLAHNHPILQVKRTLLNCFGTIMNLTTALSIEIFWMHTLHRHFTQGVMPIESTRWDHSVLFSYGPLPKYVHPPSWSISSSVFFLGTSIITWGSRKQIITFFYISSLLLLDDVADFCLTYRLISGVTHFRCWTLLAARVSLHPDGFLFVTLKWRTLNSGVFNYGRFSITDAGHDHA